MTQWKDIERRWDEFWRWLQTGSRCDHQWSYAYDFIASAILTYSMEKAVIHPQTTQTMERCDRCGEFRRKPNSSRPHTPPQERNE